MDKNTMDVMTSSKKMNWRTPQHLFDDLDKEFHFVADVASDGRNAKCEKHFTEQDDGLAQSWNLGGYVFCNPPYGRDLPKWVRKAYSEWKAGAKIVMLIPVRTNAGYFHDYILDKAKIRFIRGKVHFCDDDGKPYKWSAPFPSMIVIYD